jgi:hypothetical protein
MISDAHTPSDAQRSGSQGRLTHSGITDLASQLHAVQEHFPSIQRSSSWFVMAWILVYTVLIGPIDFVLVHKLLKRPAVTWLTFPLLVGAAVWLTVWHGQRANGGQLLLNQLDVCDVDERTNSVRATTWLTAYSPENRRYRVTVSANEVGAAAGAANPAVNPFVTWSGIPELGFRGMYRAGGFEVGRAGYRFENSAAAIADLPIGIWSTKTLTGGWQTVAPGIVESSLESSVSGQMSGQAVHRLAVPIEDWLVAYGKWVFRPRSDRVRVLMPHQPWEPANPSQVQRRELQGYLTRATTRRVQRADGIGADILTEKTKYDPLSRDPTDLWRMITFHEASGGTDYTGLTNTLLKSYDLSDKLMMDRAVMFGRLDLSTLNVEIDGQRIEPQRRVAYVRILLPVRAVGELVKELPKFQPDTQTPPQTPGAPTTEPNDNHENNASGVLIPTGEPRGVSPRTEPAPSASSRRDSGGS